MTFPATATPDLRADAAASPADRLDRACLLIGAAVPVGIVLGVVVFETLVAATGLLWLLGRCRSRRRPLVRLWRHPLARAWMGWMAAIALAAVCGTGGWASAGEDLLQLRYLLYGLALLDIADRMPVGRTLLHGLLIALALAAVNLAAAHLVGVDLVGKPLTRYVRKQQEASRLAGMAAYAGPLFLGWALLAPDLALRRRALLLGAAGVCFVALVILHLRTALIAAGAAALVPLVWAAVRSPRRTVAAALVAALVIAVLVGGFFSRRDYRDPAQLYYRVAIWKVSWDLWRDHPLTGVGITAYRPAYRDRFVRSQDAATLVVDGTAYAVPAAHHAHNLVLMVLACTGAVGLTAFAWLFATACRLAWRFRATAPWRRALLTWPLVVMVLGLTGYNIFDSWYASFFAFFLVWIGVDDAGRPHVAPTGRKQGATSRG